MTSPDFKVVKFGHVEYRRVYYFFRPFIASLTIQILTGRSSGAHIFCLFGFLQTERPAGAENCQNQDLQDERIFRIGLVVDNATGYDLHLGVLGSSDLKTLKLAVVNLKVAVSYFELAVVLSTN